MDEVSAARAEPEFSRPIHVAELEARAVTLELEADSEERRALAGRLSLLALERLTATAELEPLGDGGRVRARVNFVADVVQSCVVTLDPVPAHIEESFGLVFAPEAEIPAERGEVELDLDGEEPPEPLHEGRFDLGEAVAEHLALALDPYPRKEGAAVGEAYGEKAPEGDDKDENPFAVLTRLGGRG
jgi:uncharacterized metal-binding protein YceD (DUF177 family)